MIEKYKLFIARHEFFVMGIVFTVLTLIYLFPITQGLILLPLDLLISNYLPWYSPGTILLKNPYMQDSILQFYPWHHLVYSSLTHGIIPLWNPYQFLGTPFMAGLKPMVFYPLNVLFVFGETASWDLLVFAQIFLGLLFSYFLARDLKLSFFASIFVSMSYGLSSFVMGLLSFNSDAHILAWFPLVIFCAKRYIDSKKSGYLLGVACTYAISILAGQLQFLGYMSIFLIVFIGVYGKSAHLTFKHFLLLFMGLLLGLCLSSIQLIPSLDLFSQSHRALLTDSARYAQFSGDLLSPMHILRLLSPDFFGNPVNRSAHIGYIETSGYFGIIPLFFALIACISRKKSSVILLFFLTFIISMLLSLKGIGQILILLHIPLITNGTGGRIFILTLFSGAFLAGYGFDMFMAMKNKFYQIFLIGLFTLLDIIFVVMFYLKSVVDEKSIFLHNIQFSLIILFSFVFFVGLWIVVRHLKIKLWFLPLIFSLAIVSLTFLDLFRMGYHFLTFSNTKFLYPQIPATDIIHSVQQKTLTRTYGFTEPEIDTALGTYGVEVYNPLFPLQTANFLEILQGNKVLSTDNKYILHQNSRMKAILDILGVGIISTPRDEDPGTKYFNDASKGVELDRIYKDQYVSLYRNMTALPRFGLFYKTRVIPDNKDLIGQLIENKGALRSEVFLNNSLPVTLNEGTGSAELISSDVNSLTFHISTDQPALFYLSDTYSSGWHAYVNRRETNIYLANGNFRGVLVPSGNSMLKFIYLPQSFVIGELISGISIIGVIIGVLFFFVFKRSIQGKTSTF